MAAIMGRVKKFSRRKRVSIFLQNDARSNKMEAHTGRQADNLERIEPREAGNKNPSYRLNTLLATVWLASKVDDM